MKEYGVDLRKQYEKLVSDELALFAKIKKRRAFLIKSAATVVLKKANRDIKLAKEDDSIATYLEDIIAIEKAYVNQAKQLDMFNME